jgi:hypothetical protein
LAVGSEFPPNFFHQHFRIQHIVGQQDHGEVRGCGLSKRCRVSHARDDDVRPERHHHPAGLIKGPRWGNREVEVCEDRLATGIAVHVVVNEQHEGGVPFLIALTSASASSAPPIRAAPLFVCLVRPPKGYDVAHEYVVYPHILAAVNPAVKGLHRYPSRSGFDSRRLADAGIAQMEQVCDTLDRRVASILE